MSLAYKGWCLATAIALYWAMSGEDDQEAVHPAKIDWQKRMDRHGVENKEAIKNLSDEELDRQIAAMKKGSA